MSRAMLLVTELFPPAVGGSAILYENVYSRFDGTEVHVLTDPDVSPAPVGTRGPFRIRHASLHTPHWGISSPAGLRHHWAAAGRIASLSREAGAVVHTGRALPEGIAARAARWRGGSPYLCWAHGEDVMTARLSRELTWVMSQVYGSADAVLANSRNTRETLVEIGVSPDKILVAYPGVDSTRFRPDVDGSALRARWADGDEFLLLSVGRLQARKGQDRTIEALARLSDLPRPVRYVVVGGGEDEERLRALARDVGVADRVTFAGKIPDEDLPACYAACDLFLMPNRREGADIEGFGIVFLEAQATARPVIAGRTGGAPEAVAADETALLVSGDDADELAAAIRRFVEEPELGARFGAAGRERAAREFSWDRTAAVAREAHGRLENAS